MEISFNNRLIQPILVLFFLFALISAGIAQSGPAKTINWLTWQEAMAAREKFIAENKVALSEGKVFPKKIFIDVYTGWCGWCKKMDASTFIDPVIADYMNNNFWAVKMDGEMKDTILFNNHTFTNPNPQMNRSTHSLPASLLDYKLSYPSYILLDENLNRIAIYPGYKSSEDLLGILLFFKTNQHLTYNSFYEGQMKQKEQGKK